MVSSKFVGWFEMISHRQTRATSYPRLRSRLVAFSPKYNVKSQKNKRKINRQRAGKFPTKVTIGIDGATPQTNLSYVPNAEMPPSLQILIKRVEIFGISGKSSKFRLDFFSQVDFLEIGWISGLDA